MKSNGNIEKTELDKWATDLLACDEEMLGRPENGDRAFSQWRGITHWECGRDKKSYVCLRLVLRRIIELTK